MAAQRKVVFYSRMEFQPPRFRLISAMRRMSVCRDRDKNGTWRMYSRACSSTCKEVNDMLELSKYIQILLRIFLHSHALVQPGQGSWEDCRLIIQIFCILYSISELHGCLRVSPVSVYSMCTAPDDVLCAYADVCAPVSVHFRSVM